MGLSQQGRFAATLYLEAAKCKLLETSAQMELKDRLVSAAAGTTGEMGTRNGTKGRPPVEALQKSTGKLYTKMPREFGVMCPFEKLGVKSR